MITATKNEPSLELPLVTIKRSDAGLDDLFGYTASDVEKKSEVEVVRSGNVVLALDEFLEESKQKLYDYKCKTELILSPDEILTYSVAYQTPETGCEDRFEMAFLSKLIQNSYDHGHNNFRIKREDGLFQNGVGSGLEGTEDRQINLVVDSNVCSLFGCNSKYLKAEINGHAGSNFGLLSQHLDVKVSGNIGNLFGSKSRYMNAHIGGEIFSMGYDFYNINLTVKGDLLWGLSNSDSGTFDIFGRVELLGCSGYCNTITLHDDDSFSRAKIEVEGKKIYTRSNKLFSSSGEEVKFK
jgi:hypothetical protein